MSTEQKIIAIAAPVSVMAGEAEGENKGPAKFESTFYTGGAMRIAGYDLPVVVDLAGLSKGNVLVANLDHESNKRVGNFDAINDGRTLVARGTATAATEAAKEVVESAKQGYQWQASLEVVPHEIETLAKNKTAEVNGQTISGPAYITRKGTLKGFGFVSHGADDNTTVAIAASAASTKEKKEMKAEVEKWLKATFPSIDAESLTEPEILSFENAYAVQNGSKPAEPKKTIHGNGSITEARLQAKQLEEYETMTASYLADLPRDVKTVEFIDKVAELKEQAAEENWTSEKFELGLLRLKVPQGKVNIHGGRRERLTNEILEAAICQAGGVPNLDKHYSEQTLQAARDRFKGGISLNELFRICAEENGHRQNNYRVTKDTMRAAFGMNGFAPQHAATGFSTLDLAGILGNSAYKSMLDGWGAGEMAWSAVSDVTSVRDFKQITQYRLGGTLKYEKVGPGGELKHGTLSETSYTLQADTYGKMFAITRQHFINDDLSALTQVPRELGYGASEALNEVFWTAFLGNTWDYTSSGTTTASTVLASIQAAEKAFFDLTKPNGEPVTISPNVILAPNGAYRTIANAMLSPVVTGGSTTVPSVNSLAAQYRVERSAYLSNSAYSGYSAVKWYLCAVRPGFAPMQVAFLNGQQAPMIETADVDFNTLGVQMRGVHDFGVAVMEERALVAGSGA